MDEFVIFIIFIIMMLILYFYVFDFSIEIDNAICEWCGGKYHKGRIFHYSLYYTYPNGKKINIYLCSEKCGKEIMDDQINSIKYFKVYWEIMVKFKGKIYRDPDNSS